MLMSQGLRKFALTAHVTASVGWLGAVAAFLALAVAGLNSDDSQLVRGSYLAMDLTTRYIIWPLCLAALLTGLVQALGTSWGLFRHYWIVTKLLITVLSTLLLALHTRPIAYLASAAAEQPLMYADLRRLRFQLVADAAAALLALLIVTTLSVYKPFGMTAYGRRAQEREAGLSSASRPSRGRTRWGMYVLIAIGALLLAAAVIHLLGGGLRHQ